MSCSVQETDSKCANEENGSSKREEVSDDDDDDEIDYFESHLFGTVLWSSDPESLPVEYKGPRLEAPRDPNLFVVQKPKLGGPSDLAEGKHPPGERRVSGKRPLEGGSQPNAEGATSKKRKTLAAAAPFELEVRSAARMLESATALLIIAGAGMGVDSGLPDYRSPGGFWEDYEPVRKLGISLKEMSEHDWFNSNVKLAWGFYSHRARMYAESTPHRGFRVLKDIGERMRDGYFVFTSNIDSQFQKAGFRRDRIFESHGSLAYTQCRANCEASKVQPLKRFPEFNPDTFEVSSEDEIERCEACGDFRRPNVSFFSDTSETFNDAHTSHNRERLIEWLFPLIGTPRDCDDDNRRDALQENIRARHGRPSRVAVVEIGCGVSLHSLRCESDEVLRNTEPKEAKGGGHAPAPSTETKDGGHAPAPPKEMKNRRHAPTPSTGAKEGDHAPAPSTYSCSSFHVTQSTDDDTGLAPAHSRDSFEPSASSPSSQPCSDTRAPAHPADASNLRAPPFSRPAATHASSAPRDPAPVSSHSTSSSKSTPTGSLHPAAHASSDNATSPAEQKPATLPPFLIRINPLDFSVPQESRLSDEHMVEVSRSGFDRAETIPLRCRAVGIGQGAAHALTRIEKEVTAHDIDDRKPL